MHNNSFIYVHHVSVVEEILGPGRRLAIWTTGCPYKCDGCIEEKLRDIEYGEKISIDDFIEQIQPVVSQLKAVTFSGGEPLFQRKALLNLIQHLPESTDIMLYTGMPAEQFMAEYTEFHSYIDICVTGPFVQKLHGNLLWRGSSNQKLISPSGKYSDMLEQWADAPSKGIQLHFDNERSFIYGIPVPGALSEIDTLLLQKGIKRI